MPNSLPGEYCEFKQTVEDIRSGSLQVKYLGGGSESEVYRVAVNEKDYAVKFAKRFTRLDRPRNTVAATERKISAGLRGLGMDGLEQMRTASPQDGVAIFDFVCGITAKSMTDEDIFNVTDLQLQKLYETINMAVEAGIEFDPWNQDGSNVLYTKEGGFTLIDYFVDYAQTSPEESKLNGFKALGPMAIKLANLYDLGSLGTINVL